MLVVEGPDLVGKTTLCGKLAEHLEECYGMPTRYAHLGREAAGWGPTEYASVVLPRTICDRLHMGDVVYGQTLLREGTISPEDYLRVDAAVRLAGGLVVLLDADPSSYDEILALKQREEPFDDATLREAAHRYWMIAQGRDEALRPWTISYDEHWPVIAADGDVLYATDKFAERVAARYYELQMTLEATR
ncbi:MAG: hypothetical protein ACYTAF_07965 [Planctomycetota bacterium]|jgi:thymidylate kinase